MLLGVKAVAGKVRLLCPAIVMQFHTSDHFSDRTEKELFKDNIYISASGVLDVPGFTSIKPKA